ncbi:MAG: hypothetical protein HYZ53_20790 [Planctomycetes bacterium]|nr:hypothetical protein [Planctomycetota bacterium]
MQSNHSVWGAMLKEATARTVSGAFQRFLDQEINIPQGIRSRASTSQNHLRDFLVGEATRDVGFPRILQIADNDFLGGSFARHTKNWPLDDIDVYLPLDGQGLVYRQHTFSPARWLKSDAVMLGNPLLREFDRWKIGPIISSRKLIDGFAVVLRRHYPDQTRIHRAGEAVNVRMDEIGYDVVPCFPLLPEREDAEQVYLIPDGQDGWIHTNPRLDNAISEKLQAWNVGTFRPAVKLVKWWNKNRLGSKFSSYYIDLAVMQSFLRRNGTGDYTSRVSEAVGVAFGALRDAAFAGDLSPWIVSAPPVERGPVGAAQLEILSMVASGARESVLAEDGADTSRALRLWRVIYGDNFPAEL